MAHTPEDNARLILQHLIERGFVRAQTTVVANGTHTTPGGSHTG